MDVRGVFVLIAMAGCRYRFDPLRDAALGDGSFVADAPSYVYRFEAESGAAAAPFSFQTMGPVSYVIDGNPIGMMGSGSLMVTLIFDAPMTVYLWGNVLTADNSTDSFMVTLEGTTAEYQSSDCMFSPDWHWTGVRAGVAACPSLAPLRGFAVTAGATVLTLSSREGGSMLDQMLVTDDPRYVPN